MFLSVLAINVLEEKLRVIGLLQFSSDVGSLMMH